MWLLISPQIIYPSPEKRFEIAELKKVLYKETRKETFPLNKPTFFPTRDLYKSDKDEKLDDLLSSSI